MVSHQTSRYELKYLISEAQAAVIRDHVCAHLEADEFTRHSTVATGYRVKSLYLDSSNLLCYSQTNDGIKNRLKLRIRFYDDRDDSPVFLEVKRRVTDVIKKKRAMVTRRAAQDLLRGASADKSMLVNDSAADREALFFFARKRDQMCASGRVFVDYCREAFQTHGANQYRVTFDRHVNGSRYVPGQPLRLPDRTTMAEIPGVILEMKFINRPADWMVNLAKRFRLQRVSVPKYVKCVDAVAPFASRGRKLA